MGKDATGNEQVSLINSDGSAMTGTGSRTMQGAGASGAATVGNPVLNGSRAATANPTAVTNGQTVANMADKMGRQVTTLISVRDLYTQNTTTITASTTETSILATGGASVFHDLSMMLISNTSATAVTVDIRDALAGTVRFTVAVPAATTVPVNPVTYITQTTANSAWTAQVSASVTDVRIFIQAVKNL